MVSKINFKNKIVAVTGGGGLIGSFLCDELVDVGAKVVVIDDFSKGQKINISGLKDKAEIREGDLEDYGFTKQALGDVDIVFHLASRAYGVGYAEGRQLENLFHNELITNNLLSVLAVTKPEHILITSSSCVYDDNGPDTIPELPLFEKDPEYVNRGYGWAKRFLEKKAELFSEETGVPITIVRPFNIYGERYRWVGEHSSAIPMLVKKVMDREDPVVIWGSGKQLRSYIHANDCARMMLKLVESRHTTGPVNLGTQETISLNKLVSMICEIGGMAPKLVNDTTKPEGRFIKSSDVTKFYSILPGFDFKVSLKEGLSKMIVWYKDEFTHNNK